MRVAVLAGGTSSRFGADKLQLPWQGTDLLQHVVDQARLADLPVILLGGDRHLRHCEHLADREPGQGPLRALVDALGHCEEHLLLVAGDMPLLEPALFSHLAAQDSHRGLAVHSAGRLQPCCSIYAPEHIALGVDLLAHGSRSLHALIEASSMPRHDLPERLAHCLLNINTPADWHRIQAQLHQDDPP